MRKSNKLKVKVQGGGEGGDGRRGGGRVGEAEDANADKSGKSIGKCETTIANKKREQGGALTEKMATLENGVGLMAIVDPITKPWKILHDNPSAPGMKSQEELFKK